MMISYLQVKHGLPSLHQLLRPQPAPLPRRTVYALDFAEEGDAGRVREEDLGEGLGQAVFFLIIQGGAPTVM